MIQCPAKPRYGQEALGRVGVGAGGAGRQARRRGRWGEQAWARRAAGAWASRRKRWAQAWARGALGVSARGARPGRACAHDGQAGWVSWASLGFGEPGSVLTQFLTRF